MNGFLHQELKRSFTSRGFFLGIALVTGLLLFAVYTNTPLDQSRSMYYILAGAFASSGFTPFAAVFPVLAYGTVFCEEYHSGYLRMMLARMSWKRFGYTRILAVALSGGIMLAIPFSIVCAIAFFCGIPGVPQGTDAGLWEGSRMIYYITAYGDWYILLGKVLLGFLFGCLWALAGLAFSVWIPNKYVALLAPFVLYEAMWLSLSRLPFLNPIYLLRGDDLQNYPLSGLMELVYILVVIVIILTGLKRRCRNE